MYTTTFYSFKGGVGRTLALVNVGVELANSGKRVLLVDFDLEAPGIDTFEELRASDGQPGIVDYLCDYLKAQCPPEFDGYRYRAPLELASGGEVWVMPAGKRDTGYAARLASIDWQDLYATKNGFLLLEHLKSQWATELKPDYVLIDSRTGHTEVGGICTRQLADTVVILFIPNEQNLSGLAGVVSAIRTESSRSGRQPINLEFVASNVPSLDDEEEILKGMMRKFAKTLEIAERPLVIDRYDSLQLLNQSIFVLHRPRSHLTRSYRSLLRRISQYNLEDRDAALRAMSPQRLRAAGSIAYMESRSESEVKIREVITKHPDDAEILCKAARFCSELGQANVAKTLFDRAVEVAKSAHDPRRFQYHLEAIDFQISTGKNDGAVEDLLAILQLDTIEVHGVIRAIQLLQELQPAPPQELANAKAFQQLQDRDLAEVSSEMYLTREWQRLAMNLLFRGRPWTFTSRSSDPHWLAEAGITAIGLGQFVLAIELLNESARLRNDTILRDQFNLAMARWGATGEIPAAIFANVVALESKTSDQTGNANYEQCLALAEFAIGNIGAAVRRISDARRISREVPFKSFSCWQYLTVSPLEFLKDLESMEQLFAGAPVFPKFIADTRITR